MAEMGLNKLYLWDGMKSSLLWDESTDAWTYYSNAPEVETQEYYQSVPTIFRGVSKIAQAVGSMPFNIYGRGDKPVDQSTNYLNVLGFLPNPGQTFAIASQSLDLSGQAYFMPLRNDARVERELRYIVPRTIKPIYDEKLGKLTGFKRTANNVEKSLDVDDLIYMWLPDPDVELGPPKAFPVKAALLAAGVLSSLDAFVMLYFDRGAVRPIVVSVKGMPKKEERERMEQWFTRLMGGIKKAFTWNVFNADTVDIKQVGDGLSELRDVELTELRRQDVGMALGIPYAVLFSEAANYATAKQDKLNFYEDTIVPRCEFIQSVFNEQLLEPIGYKLEFQPQTLDIFQEDESERADALLKYTQAGYPLLMASDVLGVELSEEQRAILEEQERIKAENRDRMLELSQRQPPPFENNSDREEENKMLDDLGKWERKALNALKRGKGAAVEFSSDEIPLVLQGAIEGQLDTITDSKGVKELFASIWTGYP